MADPSIANPIDQLEGEGLRRRNVARSQDPQNSSSNTQSNQEESHLQPSTSRSKSILDLFLFPLSLLLGDGKPQDPQENARTFTHSLRRKYGEENCPHFEHTSFRDAVSTARTASKFLLVFLHSNIHEDADTFCRNTICTSQMKTFINDSDCIVAWTGCVQQMEGFGVSLALGCAQFPFLALLTCVSRGVNIVEKVTSNVSADVVIRRLREAVNRNSQILATALRAQHQRNEAQLLRQQQDREYQESLEMDRQREEEARRAEQEAIEMKEKEEEEARLKKQAEEEAIALFEATIASKRKRLEQNTPQDGERNCAVIKFHLHDGTRLSRTFYASDTLETVRDFIDVTFYDKEINMPNYELATSFPKNVWGPESLDVTIAEAGLAPRALVFVQDLDS